MSNSENTTGIRETISKILFVIGVIIILILLIFLIIRFVPAIFGGLANVGSSFSNALRGGDDHIEVTVNDNELTDNEDFILNWKYSTSQDGEFYLSYECADNATFDLISGDSIKRLICNTPYKINEDDKELSLVANYSDATSFADVPLKISFTKDGDTAPKATGEVVVTIKKSSSEVVKEETPNGNLSSATIESKPVEVKTSTTPTRSNPLPTISSPADLAIMDIYSYPNQSALSFTVRNIGGRPTGNWQFSYTNPTSDAQIINSPLQPSLTPGSGIRYTVTFSEQEEDAEGVAIVVDSFNIVNESNENNNSAAIVVTGNGTGSNNGGGYNSNDDADFRIEDLEVGYLSGNRFVRDDTLNEGDDAAIRFVVRNIGGEETDDWKFEINDIPYDNNDDYRSNRQNSLRPGEKTEIIVQFENIDEGSYDIKVEVDSDDDTDEESERNNTDTVELRVRN